TLQGFDLRVLKYLNAKHPDIHASVLVEKHLPDPKKLISLLGFTPEIYSPYFKDIEESHIKAYQEAGMKVIPWTVNDVSEMKKLKQMGVDGIITDYPDRIEAAESQD